MLSRSAVEFEFRTIAVSHAFRFQPHVPNSRTLRQLHYCTAFRATWLNNCDSWALWPVTKAGSLRLQLPLKILTWFWLPLEVLYVLFRLIYLLWIQSITSRQDNRCMAINSWRWYIWIPKTYPPWTQPLRFRCRYLFWRPIRTFLILGPHTPFVGPEHWRNNTSLCRPHLWCFVCQLQRWQQTDCFWFTRQDDQTLEYFGRVQIRY